MSHPQTPYNPVYQAEPGDFHPDDIPHNIPHGAARPRFMGAALGDEGPFLPNNPSRASIASDQGYPSNASDYDASVYRLNRTGTPVGGSMGSHPSSPHLGPYRDDPNASELNLSERYGDFPLQNRSPTGRGPNYLEEKRTQYTAPREKSRRKLLLIAGGVGGVILLLIAIAIPVYVFAIKPHSKSSGSSGSGGGSSGGGSGSGGGSSNNAISGGDGSVITMDDGTKFTYKNSFGGTWYFDPKDPFNGAAQAQSWTPAINQTFKFGTDNIRGVNLGGWLTTEPFISPALYEKYLSSSTVAVDEWTLSENMRNDPAGIAQLEDHYKTFITEQDFAEIAAAGLNFVRIALPYWAIETRGNEPFLAKTCWNYFLKAIQWARKYGIRINLDLHALPGSQNGWNHSGKFGTINMLMGPMGYANAQRSLDYIRILAEFISQPQYSDVVVMFGITNEPRGNLMGQDALSRYYYQAYQNIRTASGIGEGNGPMISYHDGFLGQTQWVNFLPNADRISLDNHPYLCFGDTQSSAPITTYATTPCSSWGEMFNTSMGAFGLSVAGEFSNAVTDCGLYVNGVNLGTRYEATFNDGISRTSLGSCDTWTNYQKWDDATKAGYKQFALASMDALQNWFFWTWKIGNSSVSGKVESPQWSYQLGLQQGWMPTDPRQAAGVCGNTSPFNGPLKPYQTGGSGAGNIPAAATATLAWPPASITSGGAVSLLPSYTPTASLITLPAPTFTKAPKGAAGSGWENTADSAGLMTDIAGCTYLDPWVGSAALPPVCTAGAAAAKDVVKEAAVTPAPSTP